MNQYEPAQAWLSALTMKYVYLIRSVSAPDRRYVGVTSNLEDRLRIHNAGGSPHTSKYVPWELVTYVCFTMVRAGRTGPERADADVALCRHHLAAGSPPGGGTSGRNGSRPVASVAHRAIRTVVDIDIKRFRSKKQFLGYAGRYARRPPIAQHRLRGIGRQEIRFVTKDTRTKWTVETTYTPADFVAALADHVPDRYLHNVRYFGLLAPRLKSQTHDAVFALLGQKRLGKPRRLRWATSLQKSFGVDPLLDRNGERMRWVRWVPPRPAATSSPKTGPVAP